MAATKKNAAPESASSWKKRLPMAGVFVAAFILAFGLAWLLFRRDAPPPPAAPAPAAPTIRERRLTAEDLGGFLQAVEGGDFTAMRRLGNELFSEGVVIPGSAALLARYAVNGIPPNQVYAFLVSLEPDSTRRVMLVVDEKDKVVSFLAEEMNVTR